MRGEKDCWGKWIVKGLLRDNARYLDDTVERHTLWRKAGDVLENDGNDDEGNKYTLDNQVQKTVYLLYISDQTFIWLTEVAYTWKQSFVVGSSAWSCK